MFSRGQLVFAVLFIVAFSIAMFWSYKKDNKLHQLYYKNWIVVLIAAIAIIAVFTIIIFSMH